MLDCQTKSLYEAKVKVMLSRNFKEKPVDIMRGIVTDMSSAGIVISGRHFQEVKSDVSGEYMERPLSKQTKVFFLPFHSIKYIDVILEGSNSEKIANKIENNPVLEMPVKEYAFSPVSGKTRADEVDDDD